MATFAARTPGHGYDRRTTGSHRLRLRSSDDDRPLQQTRWRGRSLFRRHPEIHNSACDRFSSLTASVLITIGLSST